jgi:hypothetical protein
MRGWTAWIGTGRKRGGSEDGGKRCSSAAAQRVGVSKGGETQSEGDE